MNLINKRRVGEVKRWVEKLRGRVCSVDESLSDQRRMFFVFCLLFFFNDAATTEIYTE